MIYVIDDSILNREDRQSLHLKTPHGCMHDESLMERMYIAKMMLQICSLGVETIDGWIGVSRDDRWMDRCE